MCVGLTCITKITYGGLYFCIAVTCRMPKTPKNGQLYANSSQPVTEKKSLRYGETLSYTCDTGYHLIGETHSYCTGDGQLDHQPPVCIKRNSEKGEG